MPRTPQGLGGASAPFHLFPRELSSLSLLPSNPFIQGSSLGPPVLQTSPPTVSSHLFSPTLCLLIFQFSASFFPFFPIFLFNIRDIDCVPSHANSLGSPNVNTSHISICSNPPKSFHAYPSPEWAAAALHCCVTTIPQA